MPAPAVPADAIVLISRTGPRAIVRYLVDNPDSYYGDLREALGLAVSSLTRDLRLLEEVGVVRTDVPQSIGSRRGRAPRYSVDIRRVDALLADLRSQLFG